ncbi:MAG TPA: hypothetical protein VFX16_32610 [Pseudonocardiaceae bacterium]|nr:hypothetical protein [Pseudonocardiaceae bacterium]
MRGYRLLLVLAVVCAVSIPTASSSTASSSTCGDPAAQGCVETEITRVVTTSTVQLGTFRELQLNICNSGQAGCFAQDRSPGEAAALISRYQPVVVTLNEICTRDILDPHGAISLAMAKVAAQDGDTTVFAMFTPALSRASGDKPYHCVNGDLYGIGIVGRGLSVSDPTRFRYRKQKTDTDELRAAVCATVDTYDICTTHLESDSAAVALGQCHELLDPGSDVSRFRAGTGGRPTVVAGDLNLGRAALRCVPRGWSSQGDRGVQHVLWTDDFRLVSARTVALRYTDHPALLVELAYPSN